MPDLSLPVAVGTDGSPEADRAVAWAADEAVRRGRPLRIVHALQGLGRDLPAYPVPELAQSLPEAGREILRKAEQVARGRRPDLEIRVEMLSEAMPVALRDQAATAFEIVLGNRGRGGFKGLLLGSTGLRVAGRAAGPVVIVRGELDQERGEVVAGIDPFDESAPALGYAFDAAAVRGARLRAVHAFQMPDLAPELGHGVDVETVRRTAQDGLTEAVAPWRDRFPGVAVTVETVQEHPVTALVEASRAADLVVVGAHGHGALGGLLLGSISHGAVHHAHCPVAVVRPRD